MRGSSMAYLVKEGSRNVWVNRLMSFATIGVLIACMLLIGVAVLLSVNMNSMVGYVEDQNELVVFMDLGASQSDIEAFGQKMDKMENILDWTYLSAEDVLEQQKEKIGDSLDVLHEGDNPYPATYNVKVKELERLDATVSELEEEPGVDSINAPTDIASTLVNIRQVVVAMGMGIIVLLIAVSLMIIANTIKITVFNRRREISIMKYVGATDTFIRFPFIVEGLLLGLISAVLAYFILWGGYQYLVKWIAENPSSWIQSISGNVVPFQEIGLKLFGGFAAGGIGLGVIGSMIFVRNYLKV